MNPVKRVEIVMEAAHTPHLLAVLREADVPGYTVIRDVHGMGDRGERGGDEFAGVFRNCYVLVACPAETVDRLAVAIRPLLDRYGGLWLVSDAEMLRG